MIDGLAIVVLSPSAPLPEGQATAPPAPMVIVYEPGEADIVKVPSRRPPAPPPPAAFRG